MTNEEALLRWLLGASIITSISLTVGSDELMIKIFSWVGFVVVSGFIFLLYLKEENND